MASSDFNVNQDSCKKNTDDTAECVFEGLKFGGEATLKMGQISYRTITLTCGCILHDSEVI